MMSSCILVTIQGLYIVARALLSPDGDWDDPAEIEETVQLLLKSAGT
jgi:hypothetical protein